MSVLKRREPAREVPDAPRSDVGQRASIAQVLLVARLRARNRRDLAVDTLEHAARVMLVTCRSWFAMDHAPALKPQESESEPDTGPLLMTPEDHSKGPHAHRHH